MRFSNIRIAVMSVFVCLMCQIAFADILEFKDESPRSYGLVIEQDDSNVTILALDQESGEFTRKKWPREDVKRMVLTIDQAKLSSLSINDVEASKNFAEDLASKKRDPVAKLLAIRMFALCIKDAKGETAAQIKESAVANLRSLVGSGKEQQELLKLELLIKHDNEFEEVFETNTKPENTRLLLALVQKLRQEKFEQADALLKEAQSSKESWGRFLNPAVVAAAIHNQKIEPALLHKLVIIERELRFGHARKGQARKNKESVAVSYTHLTLPTKA